MSLIKAHDRLARRARPAEIRVPIIPGVGAPPLESQVDEEKAVLEARLTELQEEVEVLVAELADRDGRGAELARETEAAIADAELRGRDIGLAEGLEAKAERLSLLEAAAGRAVDVVGAELRGLEALALMIARAALAKVFGEHLDMGSRVAALIRRQLDDLDRSAVLALEVAAADFPDAQALAELSAAVALAGVEAHASDSLASGDCRIRLRLGQLEVGQAQQWGRLSAVLDEALAAEGEG